MILINFIIQLVYQFLDKKIDKIIMLKYFLQDTNSKIFDNINNVDRIYRI